MLFEFLVLFLIFIGTLFYIVNKRPANYAPVARISFPVLGHLPYFGKYDKIGVYKLFLEWGKKCQSPIIGVDFGNYRCVVLNDFKVIKQALSMPAVAGRHQGPAMSIRGGDDGISRGLIFSDGPRWIEQRRFSLRHLKEFGFGKKSMENIFLVEAEDLIQGFRRDAGTPIFTNTRFNAAVVNSFWQICSNERFAHDDPELAKLVSAIIQNIQGAKVIGTLLFMPWYFKLFPEFSGWNTYERNFRLMDNYLKNYIEKRMSEHTVGVENDFIDVYIDEMKRTTDPSSSFYGEEGKKNLLTTLGDIFGAGSETTSTTMSWICLFLSVNHEIQDRVHNEIDHVIGQRVPLLSDRNTMPFVEAVIQETLRLTTVVVLSVFHRALEDITLNGVFIPKDTVVIPNLFGANHDPVIWGSNSDVFDPTRFLGKDKSSNITGKADNMIAFSTGRRVCIGEALARNELFILTVSLLQKFTISTDPNSPYPSVVPNFGGTVAGPQPHKLVFRERKLQ